MAFYGGKIKYMDVVEPTTGEDTETALAMCDLYRSSVPSIGSTQRPICEQVLRQVRFEQDNWERWRNHVLSPEVRARRQRFEFLATPEYLPWFVKVSHPVITNPSFEDLVMVSSTIADNEILERNRRALDAALRWMDLPPEMSTFDSARTTLTDMVNLLSGRTLSPTPTSTFPATATGTTTTTGPTGQGPRHSQHGSTSSPPTQPQLSLARPMLGRRRECMGRSIEGRI
ncbi:hypothetical protein Scep_001956 [Stephania cephalantha]|uniref:Uncharacterized protein n=1 Tax=Stephania cephalantha TaxID=152367 RepID=A0AAP0Q490_9MAGN